MIENPRLVRAKRGVARRIFLKAVGLGVAAPVAFRLARFATAAPSPAPKRLFVFFMPHGVAPEHYAPRVSESDLTSFALDQTNVSILGPLELYKEYVNVYEGFQYVGAADTHTGIVNCLSGVSVSDTTTSRTTFEHVIAKGLGVRPLILGACSHQPYGIDNNGMLFWDGTPIDPEKDPAKAADELFGVAGSEPPPEVDPDVELRRDILTLTASEIDAVSAELQGMTREQTKLAAHLEAIQKIQAAPDGGQSICEARPTLPTVEMVRAESAGQVIDPSGGNDYFYQEKNFPLLFRAQLELATQALVCNAAQVIALMPMYATCDFDFGFAGASGSHHNGLSHTNPQAAPGAQYDSPITIDNYAAEARQSFATAQRWFANELVERVVSVLASTDDPAAPGTKVLDNTLIYWMSEIGDGANHTRLSEIEYPQVPTSLPLVTIGRCAGAIKSGQVVRFPLDAPENAARTNRPATDLYLTFARAMGVEASFPSTTGVVEGVLT